jgi:hypothetical protein
MKSPASFIQKYWMNKFKPRPSFKGLAEEMMPTGRFELHQELLNPPHKPSKSHTIPLI